MKQLVEFKNPLHCFYENGDCCKKLLINKHVVYVKISYINEIVKWKNFDVDFQWHSVQISLTVVSLEDISEKIMLEGLHLESFINC